MNHTLSHIEQVARLTHAKDRDTTDAVLVEVLFSLLQPESVTLVELVPSAEGRRSVVRGHQNATLVAPVSTPPWTPLEDCPLLAQEPWREQAATTLQTQVDTTPSGADRLVVPITTDTDTLLLLEVVAPAPLRADACSVVAGFAKIYTNFLNLLDYSERDTLTSLLNRKSFDETFFKATQVRVPVFTGVAPGDKRVASMATSTISSGSTTPTAMKSATRRCAWSPTCCAATRRPWPCAWGARSSWFFWPAPRRKPARRNYAR